MLQYDFSVRLFYDENQKRRLREADIHAMGLNPDEPTVLAQNRIYSLVVDSVELIPDYITDVHLLVDSGQEAFTTEEKEVDEDTGEIIPVTVKRYRITWTKDLVSTALITDSMRTRLDDVRKLKVNNGKIVFDGIAYPMNLESDFVFNALSIAHQQALADPNKVFDVISLGDDQTVLQNVTAADVKVIFAAVAEYVSQVTSRQHALSQYINLCQSSIEADRDLDDAVAKWNTFIVELKTGWPEHFIRETTEQPTEPV